MVSNTMTLAHGHVAEQKKRSAVAAIGAPLALLFAGGLMLAAMFLPVVQSSDATTTGYTIRRHEQELADLNAHIHETQAVIAQLGSMARIQSEAKRLGMVPAPTNAISVSVNQLAPGDPVLPRRYVPAAIQPSPTPHHGVIWGILHPLSPQ